ncbi:uncharacterized protein LOC103724232 isoform X2 [Phoenix dactylifera]|uniref:Uncharacterized protein LOC103724232 isoform X2 n=1 Tax=Phoenix dactylifera TaxID=42345 RepID=A0A8B9ADM0_PHODC|nr:uncharacterized protein LOC103724232 isoform X2 [Phoenix dactylifera]
MMNRAVTDRAITGFFRQSFVLLRSLSTSVSPPAPSSSAAGESKPKRRKKKNLFDVIQFLPSWGLGYKVAKTHWQDVSYELTKDGRHGKAWGIRYKAGIRAADAPVKMSGVNKRGWKYIPESEKEKRNSSKVVKQSLA